MQRGEVSSEYRINIQNLAVEEVIIAFKSKFIELLGNEFYTEYKKEILFAVSVNEMECWLLPIYFPNTLSKASKTENCINTLNTVLKQKEGFYINEKRIEFYEKISKHFKKRLDIEKYASKNPSFNNFIQEVKDKILA